MKSMLQFFSLNDNYSATKLCYKLLESKYLNENGKVKENLKFKLNFPEFGIIDSKIPAKKDEKFDTYLFLPEGKGRKGEGGLRTKGYFKFSYEKKNGKWYIVEDNELIKEIDLDENLVKDYEKLPLITIITVVFNGEKYIEETIQSVINQTYPNVEFILIDGDSTDGTLDIIKKYEDYIDYWVSEKDSGIYNAMNKGLKLSKGDYIAILNCSDYYVNDAIKLGVKKILEKNGDYSIANVKFIDGNIIKPIIPLKKEIYQEMPYPHVSAIISKRIYKNVGFFDERFKIAGDHDMAVRIILCNYKYVYIDKVIAFLERGGISDSLESNMESLKVAIKNGKSFIRASEAFLIQIIKNLFVRIAPEKLVFYIKKLKKSRFA